MVSHRSSNGNGKPILRRVPLYFQIREIFIERIKSGQWSSRTPLPNEVQLAMELGVSVGTIRRVMDEISDLGLVRRLRGRGTFVNDVHGVGGLNGLDPLRNRDGSRIAWDQPRIEVEVGPANAKEQTALGVDTRDAQDVLRLTWLLTRNKRVVAHQRSAVPLTIGVDVPRSRHIESLSELYAHAGVLVQKCEDTLAFEVPERDIVSKMKTPDGEPLHKLTRKLFDDRKTIVGVTTSWLVLKDEVYTSSHRLVDV